MKFRKGESGNPKGRPPGVPNKATAQIREYAGQYTIEAVDALVKIARNAKMPPQARVAAWREVLDRAVGKPAQSHEITGDVERVPPNVTMVWRVDPDARNGT